MSWNGEEVPVLLNASSVVGKKVHVEVQEKNVVDHRAFPKKGKKQVVKKKI